MRTRIGYHLAAVAGLSMQSVVAQPPDLFTAIQRSDISVIEAYLNDGGDPNATVREPVRESMVPGGFEPPPAPLLRCATAPPAPSAFC